MSNASQTEGTTADPDYWTESSELADQLLSTCREAYDGALRVIDSDKYRQRLVDGYCNRGQSVSEARKSAAAVITDLRAQADSSCWASRQSGTTTKAHLSTVDEKAAEGGGTVVRQVKEQPSTANTTAPGENDASRRRGLQLSSTA